MLVLMSTVTKCTDRFFAGFPQFIQANAVTVVFNKTHEPAMIFPGEGVGHSQKFCIRTNV
jgi:hypothetical protein